MDNRDGATKFPDDAGEVSKDEGRRPVARTP